MSFNEYDENELTGGDEFSEYSHLMNTMRMN